jgi:Outer membrane protein beta-barrel domain
VILRSLAASAQTVSVGVVGGGSLVTPNVYSDDSHRYIVGPSVEVRLPKGFAVEADALYQRVGSSFTYASILSGTNLAPFYPYASSGVSRTVGSMWQFPLIGKYYFNRSSKFQPFAGLGPELRTTGWHTDGSAVIVSGPSTTPVTSSGSSESRSNNVGAAAMAGMRLQIGRLKLSPQFRFTRWSQQGSLRRNEAGLMLGIHF